jgi:hypothetical protein
MANPSLRTGLYSADSRSPQPNSSTAPPNTTELFTQQPTGQPPNSHTVPAVRPRGERAEGIAQTVIMLAIGGAAGAASFTHVHDLAAAHGQPGWLAWADAITLEAASIAAGLDLRRRKRAGKSTAFPATVLACAVALSLAAQVVEAEFSVIGWLAAALPALGFLAMVKMALGRADTFTDQTADHGNRLRTVQYEQGLVPDEVGTFGTGPDRSRSAVDVSALVPAARAAAQTLTGQGVALTRTSLARQMRADGHALSTAAATALVRLLRNEAQPGELPAAAPVTATEQ